MPFERFAAQGRKLTAPGSIYLPSCWLKPQSMWFWMWEGVGGNVEQSSCVGVLHRRWLVRTRSVSQSVSAVWEQLRPFSVAVEQWMLNL